MSSTGCSSSVISAGSCIVVSAGRSRSSCGMPFFTWARSSVNCAELNRRRRLGRLRPVVVVGRRPNRETAARTRPSCRSHASRKLGQPVVPPLGQRLPIAIVLGAQLAAPPFDIRRDSRLRAGRALRSPRDSDSACFCLAACKASDPVRSRSSASRCGNVCPARPISLSFQRSRSPTIGVQLLLDGRELLVALAHQRLRFALAALAGCFQRQLAAPAARRPASC